jgi:hypothetical protein
MTVQNPTREMPALAATGNDTQQRETPMADSPAGARNNTGAWPGREPATRTPRWVKVYGTVLAVGFVLFVVLKFTVFTGM